MDWLGDVVATWFLVAVFAACGAACVARALRLPAERAAWGPIGFGLLLYAGGSTLYNLELAADNDLTFPSRADALWLMLAPLTLAGMIGLVRARHVHVNASLWLDGMIGGTVVAALAAVFALDPILATSVGETGRAPPTSPIRSATCWSWASPSCCGARAAGASTPGSGSPPRSR